MKNSGIAVAFLVLFAAAAGAQEAPLPRLGDLLGDSPGYAPSAIDLEGTWRRTDKPVNVASAFTFSRQGDFMVGVDAMPDSREFGRRILTFSYSGQKRFVMKLANAPGETGFLEIQAEIIDPDTVLIGGTRFHRTSPPKLNDIPCTSQNPFEVNGAGAVARADVAADAKQYSASLCWSALAANLGDEMGQLYTGILLRYGLGSPKDPKAALSWFRASANQGNYDAEKHLAEMYARGEGTPVDSKESMYWAQQASETYQWQHRDEIKRTIDGLDSVFHSSPQNCVMGASPGPNPHRHIQSYCSSR